MKHALTTGKAKTRTQRAAERLESSQEAIRRLQAMWFDAEASDDHAGKRFVERRLQQEFDRLDVIENSIRMQARLRASLATETLA